MQITDLQASGIIAQTALDAARSHFLASIGQAIDPGQLDFAIDPTTSTLTVTGREYDSNGQNGQFVGSVSLGYDKVSIAQCLPYPIFVNLNYPTNVALLRTTLKNDYGVVIEEYDLAKSPGGTAMDDSIPLNGPVDANHQLVLYTSSLSGRWLPNTPVRFIFATERQGRSLAQALQQNAIASLDTLMTNDASAGWQTMMGASTETVACELLKKTFGEPFSSDTVDVQMRSLDWHQGVIQVRGLESNPVWRGYTECFYQKASIEKYIVDTLMVNITYPVQFSVLQRYLQTTFGFALVEGDFALNSVFDPPLMAGQLIDAPLGDQNTLTLYVRRSSVRWIGRETLRLQFEKSRSDFHEDLFGGAAPTQTENEEYDFAYQAVNMNPEEPITYSVIYGTAPATLSEDGQYSGMPARGFYTWTVAARGFSGGVALQTEFVEIMAGV